jgi:tetratricopeptide (TPR) repeat protein
MNSKILKGFVCCCALVLTISACATVKNFAGFFGILNTSKETGSEKNIATFARTIRPARGNPDSHYFLARYYQERGNHMEAIIEFEKTLAIDPDNFKALNAMGVSYDFLKEFKRAFECYQAALKLDPNSAYIYYNNMGQSLVLQGKYIQAIEAFKTAAAYDEDLPDARIHNNLGRAYAMSSQYDLALAEFEISSGNVSAESVLSRVIFEAGGQFPASETATVSAGDGTKTFAAEVSKFLQERREANNISNETTASVNAPQKPSTSDIDTNVCVEVSNGNGVKFTARNTRDYLIKKGFRVTRVTNGINVSRTYIYYEKGYAEEAQALASHIPVAAEIKEVSRLDETRIKVKLLVGKDMIRYMKRPSNDSFISSWIGA